MGNCLGLCEFSGTPNRLAGLSHVGTFLQLETNGKTVSRRGNPTRVAERSGNNISRVRILNELTEDVKVHFDLGEELGRGQFGVIRLCKSKLTGEQFACKSIAKGRLCKQKDLDAVRREIHILKQLHGHPRIVALKAVYEDNTWVHLVLELCEGGELFDNIVKKKVYSEKEAAETCKNLMEAVLYCHSQGVIHRDLKPENILLVSKTCPSQIKLADFGLAVKFEHGEKFSGTAGSAYYIAPEVLKGDYNEQVDVWSSGVILYILLCGVPPFWDSTEEGILEAIKIGHLDLVSDPWPSISSAAKRLIRGMLCPHLKKRLSPEQVLSHEWIVTHTQALKSENFLVLRLNSDLSWSSDTPLFVSKSLVTNDSYLTTMSSLNCTSIESSIQSFSLANSEVFMLQATETAPEKRSSEENREQGPAFDDCEVMALSDGAGLCLQKCSSFTRLVDDVTQCEFSGSSLSKVLLAAIPLPQTNIDQCTLLKFLDSQETQIVDLSTAEPTVVCDSQQRIDYGKHMKEVEVTWPLEINKLLWSPCLKAINLDTQAQLIC